MGRSILLIASCSGALAVVLGAFGAHALKSRLTPDLLAIYQTGVQYHFYHTFALLACGVLIHSGVDNNAIRVGAYAFIVGTFIFSGSLYVLAIADLRWLGAITPVGGVALIAGWIALAIGVMRSSSS
jgi:uncharacterized membrane protein YgdD (TMEM256/DUF423 family)